MKHAGLFKREEVLKEIISPIDIHDTRIKTLRNSLIRR